MAFRTYAGASEGSRRVLRSFEDSTVLIFSRARFVSQQMNHGQILVGDD